MSTKEFHKEQEAAGTKIVQEFTTRGKHYAILWALCQSGKSGTFHWVAQKMLETGVIKRVYILCGSAEVCLREQAEQDARDYNPTHVKSGALQVIFRTGFKKLLRSGGMNIEDTLIIIDESHLDQSKDMELDKFLSDERHALNLTGYCPEAVKARCRILSVSATPYAEIAALKECERLGLPASKAIINLQPGKNYVGIQRFLDDGKIRATFDITKDSVEEFSRFLKKKDFVCKYNIMRVKNRAAAKTIRKSCHRLGYPCISYTSKDTELAITEEERIAQVEDAVDKVRRSMSHRQFRDREDRIRAKAEMQHPWLGEAPEQTTVILIKDRLRAGKVVPKEFIGFVWEDAVKSNTDTLVQALLGRMCGYYKAGQYIPRVYLPNAVIETHEGMLIEESELERAITFNLLPRFFSHSVPGHLAKELDKTQCVPILLKGVAKDRKYINSSPLLADNIEITDICLEALRSAWAAGVPELGAFTPDQIAEVAKILADPEAVSLRHIQSKNPSEKTDNWFEMILESNRTRTTLHGVHKIADLPSITFFPIYEGYAPISAEQKKTMKFECGDVYAIFYTDAKGKLDALDYKLRFGGTDKGEIYSGPGRVTTRNIFTPSFSAFEGTLSNRCLEDPEFFAAEFRKILTCGLRIKELEDKERGYIPFNIATFDYDAETKQSKRLAAICNKLESDLGIHITIHYKPGLFRKDTIHLRKNFHVNRITWSSNTKVSEDPV